MSNSGTYRRIVDDDATPPMCPDCNGLGEQPYTERLCRTCGGSGERRIVDTDCDEPMSRDSDDPEWGEP
jgi:DnaJ-class molecular chaperone